MIDKLQMVVTDLDGTLLNDNRKVSVKDFETLKYLQSIEIKTVIATGRSLFSLKKVIDENFPIDYVIFSCGAGVYDFKNKILLKSYSLSKKEMENVASIFIKNNIDFSIQMEIPENHRFLYYQINKENPDFERRCKLYKGYCDSLNLNEIPKIGTQLLGITEKGEEKLENVKDEIKNLKVIRSTSPLDHKTIWIEVFHKNVSKASGIELLKEKLNIKKHKILAVGNDYNDIDMLDYCEKSFVVDSAPTKLKDKYKVTTCNNTNGFTNAITSSKN